MENVPLREHLEALNARWIRDHQSVHEQEAIVRAEAARRIDERLEALNELRTEVLTDRARLVNREVFDAKIQALDIRIDALHDQITEWRGRGQGLSLGASIIVGAVGVAATLIAVYLAVVN